MRLLALTTPDEIGAVLASYRKESRALIGHIHEICWFMRGSISREDAWNLSLDERKSIMKLIDANIERVNKTKMPIL